jgi:hypothetical protein
MRWAILFCLLTVFASGAAWAHGLGIGSQTVVNNVVPSGAFLFGGAGATCNLGANGCLLNDIHGRLLAR